jgi:hypothetical protein
VLGIDALAVDAIELDEVVGRCHGVSSRGPLGSILSTGAFQQLPDSISACSAGTSVEKTWLAGEIE